MVQTEIFLMAVKPQRQQKLNELIEPFYMNLSQKNVAEVEWKWRNSHIPNETASACLGKLEMWPSY